MRSVTKDQYNAATDKKATDKPSGAPDESFVTWSRSVTKSEAEEAASRSFGIRDGIPQCQDLGEIYIDGKIYHVWDCTNSGQ